MFLTYAVRSILYDLFHTVVMSNVCLVLFHHDPYHDDAQIDRMLQTASAIFPDTVAESEGMVIELRPAERANAPSVY